MTIMEWIVELPLFLKRRKNESLQSPYKTLVTLQKMRSHRSNLPTYFMDDPIERFIDDLSSICRQRPNILEELVLPDLASKCTEEDFTRWEETLKQLRKNTESPDKYPRFSSKGLPLHMFDSYQIQELSPEDVS